MLEGAFCAQCGQKVTPLNPSLHDFLHDLVHEFLHFDGKIFRSVRLLSRNHRLSGLRFDDLETELNGSFLKQV
jgi:hypothetical protein